MLVDRPYPRLHGPVTLASLHVPPEPARCTRGQLARTVFLPDGGRPQPDGAGFYSAEATGPPPPRGAAHQRAWGGAHWGRRGCALWGRRAARGLRGRRRSAPLSFCADEPGCSRTEDTGAAGAQGPQGAGAGRRRGARAGFPRTRVLRPRRQTGGPPRPRVAPTRGRQMRANSIGRFAGFWAPRPGPAPLRGRRRPPTPACACGAGPPRAAETLPIARGTAMRDGFQDGKVDDRRPGSPPRGPGRRRTPGNRGYSR